MSRKAEQKSASHASIVESACRMLREKGIAGARVADVMRGAGLTVGGFYAHFGSKEALVDEAIRRTSAATLARLFDGLDEKPIAARAEVVMKRYLSAAHRDRATDGCPFPAIVGEVATDAPAHRGVLGESIAALATRIAEERPGDPEKRAIALGLIALMIGGLTLARALGPTALSDELIAACRRFGKRALG